MTQPSDENLPKAKIIQGNPPAQGSSIGKNEPAKPGAVPMGRQQLPSGKIVKPAPRAKPGDSSPAIAAPVAGHTASARVARKQGGTGWMIALGIFGVFGVLLVAICGGVAYFGISAMNSVKQTVDTAARNTSRSRPTGGNTSSFRPQANTSQPAVNDLTSAKAALASLEEHRQRTAMNYLANNPSSNPAEKTAVAARMIPHLSSSRNRGDAARALKIWATSDNLPALTTVMQTAVARNDRSTQNAVIEILIEVGDADAAPVFTSFMVADQDYRLARKAMGSLPAKVSTPRLLPYMHDDNRHHRDTARQILAANKVAANVLVGQSVKDLHSSETARQRHSINWLVDHATVVPSQQTAVTSAAAALFDNSQTRHDALRVVKRWATSADVDVLLAALNHPDHSVRQGVRTLFTSWEVESQKLLQQTAKDLGSDDDARMQAAVDYVTREIEVDDDAKPSISTALGTVLNHEEARYRHRALDALEKWATNDVVPTLINQLDHQDHGVRDRATKILVKLKDPRAIKPLVDGFDNIHTRYAVRNHLIAFGPIAETALHPYLDHADWQVAMEAARVLAEIGTEKSIPPLLKIAQKDNRSHQGRAAEQAIIKIRAAKRTAPEVAVVTTPKNPPNDTSNTPPVDPPTRPDIDKSKFRTWTDKTGRHKIEAEFVELIGTRVKLRTEEGKLLTLSLNFLSQADQDFIKSNSP